MVKTICLILCAGKATRWSNYLNVNKHFIKIDGEPLIKRTIRLFNKYCQETNKIYIVGHSNKYSQTQL